MHETTTIKEFKHTDELSGIKFLVLCFDSCVLGLILIT